MIHFTCPCGKALHAKEEYAGETTRCPQCGRELPIPGDRAIQAEAPPPPEPPAESVRRGRRGRGDDRDRAERPRPPATSGMAIGSTILGVLSLCLCSVFTGIPAIILGALGLRAIGRSEGRLTGKGLAITGLVTGGLSLLLVPALLFLLMIPAVSKVREAASKTASANNLRIIDIGLIDYADNYQFLPNSAICDPNGKPLLSWRVAILPYIEEESLYRQFKLDEPWDGPNNSRLIAQMPKTYALPGETTAQPGYTYYRAFVAAGNKQGGIGTAFASPRPGQPGGITQGVPFPAGIPDGSSNTILVVEAGTAVPWTKPDELPFDPVGPLPPLGGHFGGGFGAAMADGEVRFVSSSVSQQTLRAAITANGGEVLGPDW